MTFTGAQRYWDTSAQPTSPSLVAFVAPNSADYVADLQLSQGALTLGRFADELAAGSSAPTGGQDFASSGSYSLGHLDRSQTGFITVQPHDGPTVRWQLSIRELPVQLANLTASARYVKPRQVTRLGFTTSGGTSIDAAILNSSGQPVRQLAAKLAVDRGDHTVSWDGLDESGTPTPDGSYTFAVTSIDPTGAVASSTLPLLVDATPPGAQRASPGSLQASHGLVIAVADAGSGVKSARLNVDGKNVATLAATQTEITYAPKGGWIPGRHTFVTVASDEAGNQGSKTGTFNVIGKANAYLICNVGGLTPIAFKQPRSCTVLPPWASFATGANLANLTWKDWGKPVATATATELGFHLPSANIPVRVTVSGLRYDTCTGLVIYSRVHAENSYGGTTIRTQTCANHRG